MDAAPSPPDASRADLFADARNHMVDSQVRPNKVTDPRILAAMRRIPREGFVPAESRHLAYLDRAVPLGGGRFLIEPMVVARLIQIAQPMTGERALVVAAGTGYGAALLAATGANVTALEDDPALLALARDALPAAAPTTTLVQGPPAAGWPQGAPYDLILIEGGAVPAIPAALGAQLRQNSGRVVAIIAGDAATPVGAASRLGQAVLAEPTPEGLHARAAFDCGTPPLPALRRAPGFTF